MGEHGDFSRRYVLDPIMLPLALKRSPKRALDVGCGEGRFCRMLGQHGVKAIGIDPTPALIAAAHLRDVEGQYLEAGAELLPFADATFDLVVSYLTLIDFADFGAAISEMVRVLKPGGALLIACINSFNSACGDTGWIKDSAGRRLYYPIDHYLEDRSMRIEYRGISIVNYHRPLSAYMAAFLAAGLLLTYFSEPCPSEDAPVEKAVNYRRVPWFLVMEWVRPA